MTGGSWITHHFVYNFVESLEFLASNLRNEIRGEVGRRIPNTQNCQQITNESPRAPRNLTPPGSSDKPTWRCQQIPLIGALGIQVICYPRRAFQERLINDRKVEDGSTPGSWRGRAPLPLTAFPPSTRTTRREGCRSGRHPHFSLRSGTSPCG